MVLHLMHCLPEPRQLALWGERHDLLHMKQSTGYQQDDAGYALHALLRTAFGALAPKPFWYRGAREGLLAFTTHDPEALRQNAALAPPEIAAVLGLDAGVSTPGLIFRRYPTTWETGHQLNFEVRVRPVVRVRERGARCLPASSRETSHRVRGSDPCIGIFRMAELTLRSKTKRIPETPNDLPP